MADQNLMPRRRFRFGRFVLTLLLLFILGSVLWTWFSLSWSYADGERAGVLQKFIRRGWVCKTYEGEIALYYGGGQYLGPGGTTPQLWDFSVRDATLVKELNGAVGHRVQLHYTEHPGLPSTCFAETRYFVDKVTITDGAPATPAPAKPDTIPPASTPTPAPAN